MTMHLPHVSIAQACKLVERGGVLIDVRDPIDFRNKSVPGSVNIPLRRISEMVKHQRNTPIIVYGGEKGSDYTTQAIKYLLGFGFSRVYVLILKAS